MIKLKEQKGEEKKLKSYQPKTKFRGLILADLEDNDIDRKLAVAAKILGSINTRGDFEAESSVQELLAIIKDCRGGKAEV